MCFFNYHHYLNYFYLTENKIKIHRCYFCNNLKTEDVFEVAQEYKLERAEMTLTRNVNLKVNNKESFEVTSMTTENSVLNLKLTGTFKVLIYGKINND